MCDWNPKLWAQNVLKEIYIIFADERKMRKSKEWTRLGTQREYFTLYSEFRRDIEILLTFPVCVRLINSNFDSSVL